MTPRLTLRYRNWIVRIARPSAEEFHDPLTEWKRRLAAVRTAIEQQDRAALAAAHGELVEVREEEAAVLGGKLVRNIIGQWTWSDGTPDPRVRDLYAWDCWPNYRVRASGDDKYVEVLASDLKAGSPLAEELAWCRDYAVRRSLSLDHVGQRTIQEDGRVTRAYADPATGETTGACAIPEVLLVPVDEWDRRGLAQVGATWDKADEPAILAKARSLGWA